MRILMLGSAAILLSGCSFLGLNDSKANTNYNAQTGYYGQQAAVQPTAATRCHSGNCLSRWNIEGGVGAVFPAGNNIITASRVNEAPNREYSSSSFGDAYDTGVRAELGGSYALAPNTKVSLIGHYEHADSNGVQDLGVFNGRQITGALTDYKSYGAELGLRQYFAPTPVPVVKSIRPYVEARAGVSRVDDIDLVGVSNPNGPIGNQSLSFYEDSWVGTAAGLVGVETPVAKYTTIGLETGIRYQGGLESDTNSLPPALNGLNNNRGRVSIPLTLRGRYRF